MNNKLEILMYGQQFKKLYEKMFNPISKKYGLTKMEIEVLLFLEKHKSYDTAKDIVEWKFFAKSHVSKAIDFLMKNGYVLGNPDEHDRRSIHLKLAGGAEQVTKEAIEIHNKLKEIIYKGITVEEKEVMEAVAKKIATNIKEELNNED